MRWFATPKWEAERVCVGDLVFRLTLGPDAGLTPRDDCFELMKSRTLMEEYERFFASIADRPQRVLELGIRDGGSVALWNELLRPLQHAAVDISTRGDSPYFREWVTRRGLGQRVRTYWG